MEQIILYVDDLVVRNGMPEIGSVTNPNTIAYNNEKMLGSDLKEFTDSIENYNQSQVIGKAGRYLTLTGISLDEKIFNMLFLDFRKDRGMALKMANNFDSEDAKEKFMDMFQFISQHYEKDFDNIKLVKGVPPL